MTSSGSARTGRNDPCPCGSGRKYKACHLEDDLAQASAQREEEQQAALEEGEADSWPHYHPHTHKVPAARRPDFLVVVRNLAMKTGDEARLVIHQPSDLGRDQASVDQAIAFLRDNRVEPDFMGDPPPPVIAAIQELLDRVLGRGVCVAAQSGYRLRRYGRTELVLDEGGGSFTVYVSGRAISGVVRALHLAIQQDAAALGIDDSKLSAVWCLARLVREIAVNVLALPAELAQRSDELVEALVLLLSDMVDSTEPKAPDDRSAVEAVAGLPYLLGLREARREPRLALEGMGHSGAALDALAAQLEAAVDGPDWVLALEDLADEGWDTPEGYNRWVAAAEAASAAPWLGAVEMSADPAWPDVLVAPARPGSPRGADVDAVPAGEEATGHRPASAAPEPVGGETASAFAPVEAILALHAERRRSTELRLQEVFDRRAAAARARRDLQAQFETLDAEDASAAAEEERVTGELDLLADAEAADRRHVVTEVLTAGRAALDESAASWSVDANPRDERDQVSLTAAERTVADFDAMERGGMLAQLPGAVRAKLTADAEAARDTLHAMLGGRDPVRVPVVVVASADPSLALRVALPFAGRDELVPGGLHTSVAIAIAGVLAETVEAVAEASLETVEHETLESGISIVHFRFSSPPPVPADEYAEFVATSLTDLSRTSVALREAGVSIEARVELDLEPEAA